MPCVAPYFPNRYRPILSTPQHNCLTSSHRLHARYGRYRRILLLLPATQPTGPARCTVRKVIAYSAPAQLESMIGLPRLRDRCQWHAPMSRTCCAGRYDVSGNNSCHLPATCTHSLSIIGYACSSVEHNDRPDHNGVLDSPCVLKTTCPFSGPCFRLQDA